MQIAAWVIIVAAVLVLAVGVFLYRRRRILVLRGAIGMSVHRGRGLRGGWALGVARYADEHLEWFRLTSFRAGPSLRIARRDTQIREREEPSEGDSLWMPPDAIVLHLSTSAGPQLVAVPKSALPGLLSWWESAPPSWMATR
ncbi:DUF2550 domain-containing protein [Blastococcus sp. Marseille-P5729]|uniref:DUF2550 domain-containing protein n=1 Tax=Blastococcus sp. Marseille-P5729 TaxID=2086582 RepID=UPI000D0EE131|nr:DUF2550 domain-containing protein [Blastococcus sp. Marseille-P5729]